MVAASEYRQTVRQLAGTAFQRLHPEMAERAVSAARSLAGLYVGIAEAESVPRLTFRAGILERAYEAFVLAPDPDPADQRPEAILERSSLRPDYSAAYPYMQQVMEVAFRQIRRLSGK